jgi:hypothetical protein
MEQFEIRPISRSRQPHRFFERTLNNDLEKLAQELEDRYALIKEAKIDGVTEFTGEEPWSESGSVSTSKWDEYNVFQFHIDGIYNLYRALGEMVREACEYYDIDFEEQKFMVQGWFNINHVGNGKLDWHEHGPGGAPFFHGYYAVKAEPSETHYITTSGPKVNVNKNNKAILSEMGHPHAMGDWSWEGARITVAYDVLPLSELMRFGNDPEQHWIPLP